MCTHFRSYLQGAQFTLRTDHSSLRWLQKFCNGDGMLARWYMLLGQFSATFEYRPGAQHANADSMSRQCGQCSRPDCPVSSPNSRVLDVDSTTVLLDQPIRLVRNGRLHGRGFVAGAVWGNLGGSNVAGINYSRFATSCIKSGPYCGISAGCNFDNCSWVGTVGGNPGVVRMFGTVSGAAALAVADWELVSGHGREIVALLGSSVRGLSTRGTRSGASGDDSSIS